MYFLHNPFDNQEACAWLSKRFNFSSVRKRCLAGEAFVVLMRDGYEFQEAVLVEHRRAGCEMVVEDTGHVSSPTYVRAFELSSIQGSIGLTVPVEAGDTQKSLVLGWSHFRRSSRKGTTLYYTRKRGR